MFTFINTKHFFSLFLVRIYIYIFLRFHISRMPSQLLHAWTSMGKDDNLVSSDSSVKLTTLQKKKKHFTLFSNRATERLHIAFYWLRSWHISFASKCIKASIPVHRLRVLFILVVVNMLWSALTNLYFIYNSFTTKSLHYE